MEAKDICVSLETAKALSEAGIVVESYFAWATLSWKGGVSDWHIETMADVGEYSRREEYKINYYPAPTAAELWGILPKRIDAFDLTIRNNATVAQNDKVRACYQYFSPDAGKKIDAFVMTIGYVRH